MAKRLKTEAKTETAKPRSSSPPKPKLSERAKLMAAVARKIDGATQFSRAPVPLVVPTRITSLNRALSIGGFSCGMLGVLHGPSQGGKSVLLAEIMAAAHATGGFAHFVDAECRAVDLKWYEAVMGSILDEVIYQRPKTYEDAIDEIEKSRALFREAKEGGKIPESAVFVAGIDSINRLTPKDELANFRKKGVNPRSYPLRALLTSKWLDQVVPTLEIDESIVFIQREADRLDAMPGQRTWKVKGGRSIAYDGGWVARIENIGNVKTGDEASSKVGEKHRVSIMKNSMGARCDEVAFFYTSAGKRGQPLGFDFVREVREEAIGRGLLVYKSGKGYIYHGDVVASSKKELPKWLGGADEDGEVRWSILAKELNDAISNPG